MKNLSLFKVLFLALAIFGISSCGADDGTGDGEVFIGPTISTSITSAAGADVVPGDSFTVEVTGAKGDGDLSSLTIQEAGTTISADRITIVDIDPANNPQAIPESDAAGFSYTVTVVAHSDEAEVEYTFQVTDKNQETATSTETINTIGTGAQLTVSINNSDPITTAAGIFNFNINAVKGNSELASIAVYEDGTVISADRLRYEGVVFTANPQDLTGGDIDGLTNEAIGVMIETSATLRFEVMDVNGNTAFAEIDVIVGTDVSEIQGVLLNQAGPVGQGGMVLSDGTSVGSAAGDIRDQGIDNTQPDADNWIQKISPNAGVEMKYASDLPDGSGYDDITTQEEIAAGFDGSTDLAGGVSDIVVIGDEFIAKKGDDYYFLKVTNVEPTANNNLDQYTFSIKQ